MAIYQVIFGFLFSLNSIKVAKEALAITTFYRWQRNKRNIKYSPGCDVTIQVSQAQKYVELLWYTSCRKFEEKIWGVKNFFATWTSGSANHRLSNVSEHARSGQHKLSMSWHKFKSFSNDFDVLCMDKQVKPMANQNKSSLTFVRAIRIHNDNRVR